MLKHDVRDEEEVKVRAMRWQENHWPFCHNSTQLNMIPKNRLAINKCFLELKIDYGVLGEVTQMKKKFGSNYVGRADG